MSNLNPFDLGVMISYLMGVLILGSLAARRIRNAADFFMPRRFGKTAMMMHAFGTGTASDQAVSVASATAAHGLSGIWYQWMWLFSTPFYWLIAPIMRRFRAVTTADVYAFRYDRSVSVLFAAVGIAGLAVKIGVMLVGAGALISAGTGGLVEASIAIPAVTILFVVYGMAGGLGGAIATDFVQGVMTILFSLMLLPVILGEIGGFHGMRATLSGPGMDQDMLSLVAPQGIGLFYIAMLSINSLFLIVAMPSVMGNCAAGRSELDGRVGFMCGTFVKRICTIAWCLTAIAAVAWYHQNGVDLQGLDPDRVYGDVAHRFLPRMLPGMLGLFIASLLAAVMSSCDSFMIAASGLFTENLYRPLRPHKSEREYIWIGRAVSLIVVLGGLLFAYSVEGVVAGLKVWYKVVPMMGIAFWLGLLWRRATAAGAWASALVGFATWWLLTRSSVVGWIASLDCAEKWMLIAPGKAKLAVYEPWLILGYLTAGTMAGILISLATRPPNRERLDAFYALTRTPIQPQETVARACELPENVIPEPRPMFLTALGLEIPYPSATSIVGFIGGWIAVAALIGGFVWLVQ